MARNTDHLGRPVVVVTGIGVVTSLGIGVSDNWAALTAGTSGIHPITRFPVDHLNTRIAGTVDFLPSSSVGAAALTHELAETAAREALVESGFGEGAFGGPLFLASPPLELDWHERFDLYSRMSEEEGYARLLRVARERETVTAFENTQFGAIADRLARTFGTRGLPITLSTACASGATAIQLGVEAIRRGECERALSIGTDGSATAEALIRFSLLSALSTSNDIPEKASKPFSKDRDGFVLAEGSAALVLESLESATARVRRSWASCGDAARRRTTSTDPLQAGRVAGNRSRAGRAFRRRNGRAGDRLCERARHLDSRERQDGAPVALDGLRPAHEVDADLIQQVDDRPHAVGRRRDRGCVLDPDHARRRDPTDDQSRHRRPRHRPRRRAECEAARRRPTVLSNSFGFGGQNTCLVMAREPV